MSPSFFFILLYFIFYFGFEVETVHIGFMLIEWFQKPTAAGSKVLRFVILWNYRGGKKKGKGKKFVEIFI